MVKDGSAADDAMAQGRRLWAPNTTRLARQAHPWNNWDDMSVLGTWWMIQQSAYVESNQSPSNLVKLKPATLLIPHGLLLAGELNRMNTEAETLLGGALQAGGSRVQGRSQHMWATDRTGRDAGLLRYVFHWRCPLSLDSDVQP